VNATVTVVMQLLAGIGLFLYGMKLMSDGLAQAAGGKLRHLLEVLTASRARAVFVGILFTMVVQSSSATTVMVVGFVNAGLLNLIQAVGVVMGANIGTTITAQLIAFRLTTIAPVILLIGVVMLMFIKKPIIRKYGIVVLGFGMLFMGMNMMGDAMKPIKDSPQIISMLSQLNSPILAFLAGLVLTAIIQSSSAAVGLVQVMAMQGLVTLDMAVFIILGSNIGTCVDALMAAVGGRPAAKQTALAHLFLNIFGSILIALLLSFLPLTELVRRITPGDVVWQIANAHTLFKILEVVVFFPLANQLVRLVVKLVPNPPETENERRLVYLDDEAMTSPTTMVVQLVNEVKRMGHIAIDNLDTAMRAFVQRDPNLIAEVVEREATVNFLNHSITRQLVRINQAELPAGDYALVASMFHVVNDFERIGDHAENLSEFAQTEIDEKMKVSDQAMQEIAAMYADTKRLLHMAMDIFDNRTPRAADAVVELEEHIDDEEELLHQAHIDRLNQGLCTPANGVLFLDVISNLERVADHATNIAFNLVNDDVPGQHPVVDNLTL
jgi:phosphate:Na+ symporter